MDRSFLAFKQLLLRLINGPEETQLAAKPIARTRTTSRPPATDVRDDWVRLEL